MGARDALFQHGRIPGQIDVDDRVRRLKVEPGGTGVGREEQAAGRIVLKLVHQLLPLFLRHRAVEPDEIELKPPEQRLDQRRASSSIRRRARPCALPPLPARRTGPPAARACSTSPALPCPRGRCCSAAMRAISNAFRSRSRSISVIYFFATIELTITHVRGIDIELFVCRRNAHDLRRARRQVLHHGAPRAAQQDRLQLLAQLVEILVAEHLALLVTTRCWLKKRKPGPSRRSSMNCTTEYSSSSRFSSGVPESTSANRELQPLDDAARLRFPVLDPLAFVENDQVPRRSARSPGCRAAPARSCRREEAVVPVLLGALARRRRR